MVHDSAQAAKGGPPASRSGRRGVPRRGQLHDGAVVLDEREGKRVSISRRLLQEAVGLGLCARRRLHGAIEGLCDVDAERSSALPDPKVNVELGAPSVTMNSEAQRV